MGTHKSSSTGKPAKGNHKNSVKESSAKGHAKEQKEKHPKPASKFSSIKQALFGGSAPKKGVAPGHAAAKPAKKEPKKEPMKGNHKPSKGPAKEMPSPAHAKEPVAAAHLAKEKSHKEKSKQAPLSTQPSKKPAPVGTEVPVKAPSKRSEGSGRTSNGAGRSSHSRSGSLDSGESVCREVACEGLATSAGYCRLHYIKNWKKIKRKEVILKEGKLNQYIEELVIKYPDKYIEAIRQDLANDKDFAKVIYDLDLDESLDDFDADAEASDTIIDSIKRDFDDEGDTGF